MGDSGSSPVVFADDNKWISYCAFETHFNVQVLENGGGSRGEPLEHRLPLP